ncbi:unnamed protein product, partial [Musa textilis]
VRTNPPKRARSPLRVGPWQAVIKRNFVGHTRPLILGTGGEGILLDHGARRAGPELRQGDLVPIFVGYSARPVQAEKEALRLFVALDRLPVPLCPAAFFRRERLLGGLRLGFSQSQLRRQIGGLFRPEADLQLISPKKLLQAGLRRRGSLEFGGQARHLGAHLGCPLLGCSNRLRTGSRTGLLQLAAQIKVALVEAAYQPTGVLDAVDQGRGVVEILRKR